jgi:hypothetical protein
MTFEGFCESLGNCAACGGEVGHLERGPDCQEDHGAYPCAPTMLRKVFDELTQAKARVAELETERRDLIDWCTGRIAYLAEWLEFETKAHPMSIATAEGELKEAKRLLKELGADAQSPGEPELTAAIDVMGPIPSNDHPGLAVFQCRTEIAREANDSTGERAKALLWASDILGRAIAADAIVDKALRNVFAFAQKMQRETKRNGITQERGLWFAGHFLRMCADGGVKAEPSDVLREAPSPSLPFKVDADQDELTRMALGGEGNANG